MAIPAFIEPAAAVTIIGTLVIVLIIVYFLCLTIAELRKISQGLAVVLDAVGEIITKSAPVNELVDTINNRLAEGRDILENLLLKKAGDDSAGLVESLFPGEGKNFLQRVRRRGPVRNIREVYTRGVTTLAHLGRSVPLGEAHERGPAIRDTAYASAAAGKLYTPGVSRTAGSPIVGTDAPRVFDPSTMPVPEPEPPESQSSQRAPERSIGAPEEAGSGSAGGGEGQPAEEGQEGRIDEREDRPWER